MAISLTEKVLANNKFYTDKYLKDSINLTKSITLVNAREAALYNDYIRATYPGFQIDATDKSTWRYYLHLAAQYHPLDRPVTLTSIDNGETITLTATTIALHRITRTELLKFDLLYKELVDRYPEQELYIKSLINTSAKPTLPQILTLPDYHIVSYNDDLVEDNEDDVIQSLQERIDNYKNISLISYYSLSDNLFLASQYHILYTYLLKTLLALRLKNAKTLRAHSYHILNYLSSHHHLDVQFNYLTKKQALFLYRNLLYLNNHAGRDEMFRLLIDKLFTERNISVVGYTYEQANTLTPEHHTDYRFKQKLLNRSDLVYSYQDYQLEDIHHKERPMAPSNPQQITYHASQEDQSFKNSLFSTLLTKDLETIIVDNTDTVKYKLIPTLVDYWAYLLKTNKISYLVTVLDPITNKELRLSTKDLFKLFVLTLYKLNNQELTGFPDYTITRVYRPTLPTTEQLLSAFYRPKHYYPAMVETITTAVPRYTTTITSYQFYQFLSSVYRFNIGLWLLQSNLSDKDTEGQFEHLIARLHTTETYQYHDETPAEFLKRIGMDSLYLFDPQSLQSLQYAILNNLFDNQLSFVNEYQYIQKALIEVFQKFNSYTVQIIDNYTAASPLLAGPQDPRYTVTEEIHSRLYYYDAYNLNIDMQYGLTTVQSLPLEHRIDAGYAYHTDAHLPLTPALQFSASSRSEVAVYFKHKILNGLGTSEWVVNPSSEADLEFLALHS